MQNQENDDEESKALFFINNASSGDESVRQQAIDYLISCTFQLNNLDTYEKLLSQCVSDQSQSSIYYCLLILRDIIINRGCLLSCEKHLVHIENLFSIAEDAIEQISSDITILNIFCDAVSFSYRFVYEKDSDNFLASLFGFFEQSEYHKIISMNTLVSILNAINYYLPHLSKDNHRSKRINFKKYLSDFYDYAFQCISFSQSEGVDPNVVNKINFLGVELLNKTTEFDTDMFFYQHNNNNDLHIGIDYFQIIASENYPSSFFFIDCLFNFFREWDPQNGIQVTHCIKNYLYLCRLVTNCKKNPLQGNPNRKRNEISLFNMFLYIIYNTNQLLSEINSLTNVDSYVQDNYDKRNLTFLLSEIARTIDILLSNKKIEKLTPSFSFFSEGIEYEGEPGNGIKIIRDFLILTDFYTKNFILIEPDDFFILWKLISNINNFDQSDKEYISSCTIDIFEFYVNYLMENEENLENQANDYFDYSQLIFHENLHKFPKNRKENEKEESLMINDLWEMMKGSLLNESGNFIISDYIHQIIEEEKDKEIDPTSLLSIQRMIILTTLISSFINDIPSLEKIFKDDLDNLYSTFEQIFNSVTDFIIFESEKLTERLEIVGEFYAKFEFCITTLFVTFLYFKKNCYNKPLCKKLINNIESELTNDEYKSNLIEHFFIDHFIDILLNFTTYTELLLSILSLFETIDNEGGSLLKNNHKMYEIATEKVQPFDLETVPFVYLKNVIPMMYRIYSSIIIKSEFDQFLETFDSQFSPELENPANCFLLYSQLYGVSLYALKSVDHSTKLFNWMFNNHLDDTIQCIRIHYQDKIVISNVIKLWLMIGSMQNKKKTIFTDENGNGIEYFRANTQILLILKDCCEESQWISMKIIHNCICGDYANYGIMDFYNDNSLDIVIENFLFLLKNWAFGEKSKRLIFVTQIIKMFPQIGITDKYFYSNEDNFYTILDFLVQNLLINNDDENKMTLWIETCNCLKEILIDNINKSLGINHFAQFFVVILDALINLSFDVNNILLNSTASVLFILMFYDDEETRYCSCVTDSVVDTFKDEYKEKVVEIFQNFWNSLDHSDKDLFEPSREFRNGVKIFSNEMKMFHVELANIKPYRRIFTRQLDD